MGESVGQSGHPGRLPACLIGTGYVLSPTHCPEENSLKVSFKQTSQSIFMQRDKILPSFTFESVAII